MILAIENSLNTLCSLHRLPCRRIISYLRDRAEHRRGHAGPGNFRGHFLRDRPGLSRGCRVDLRVVISDLIFFLLAALGLAALAHSMGDLFLFVKFAGAGYLIWLGIKLWRAPVAAPPEGQPLPARRRGFGRNVLAGVALTLGNPKTIAFYAGLLPTIIDIEKLTATDIALMMLIMLPVVGGIPTAYAYAAARARRFLNSQRRVRLMNRTAETMMIGTGVAVAVH